jgi:hypothetical protein
LSSVFLSLNHSLLSVCNFVFTNSRSTAIFLFCIYENTFIDFLNTIVIIFSASGFSFIAFAISSTPFAEFISHRVLASNLEAIGARNVLI